MRDFAAALAYARAEEAHASRDWSNLCQMFARTCVAAAAWAPSAREAFNAVPQANRHLGVPPLGALVYYGNAHTGAGHATFSAGGGYVYSTDIKRKGKVDRVPYLIFEKAWGLQYRGWIDLTPSGPISLFQPVGGGGTGVPVPPKPVVPAGPTAHELHVAHLAAAAKAHALHVAHLLHIKRRP